MSGKERRTRSRYLVEREVELKHAGGVFRGFTENLSLGGAFIRLAANPRVSLGDRVELTFSLPGIPEAVVVEAEVRWCTSNEPEAVGLQFLTGFRAKQAWALTRLLESAEKLD